MPENVVTVVGNLTDDPELRFTPQGTAVANFRLAVTARVRDGDSWKDGETSFFRVNVWRQLAENIAETLTKGTRCIVVGRLRMRSWETPEGDKRSATEIEADEVGPSLKWATAKVQRTGKANAGGSSAGQFNDEPPFSPSAIYRRPPTFRFGRNHGSTSILRRLSQRSATPAPARPVRSSLAPARSGTPVAGATACGRPLRHRDPATDRQAAGGPRLPPPASQRRRESDHGSQHGLDGDPR